MEAYARHRFYLAVLMRRPFFALILFLIRSFSLPSCRTGMARLYTKLFVVDRVSRQTVLMRPCSASCSSMKVAQFHVGSAVHQSQALTRDRALCVTGKISCCPPPWVCIRTVFRLRGTRQILIKKSFA
jgi:hypothetical protein